MTTMFVPPPPRSKPDYVYVASSWRNPMQPAVCAALAAARIDHYDFRNPAGGTGFSWREVKTDGGPASKAVCEHCGNPIAYSTFTGLGFWEPDVDHDPVAWRHLSNGYASCSWGRAHFAVPKKGSDWESVGEYLSMVSHPRAVEGFNADFDAMQQADTFVMVLPCGKSAHLELGWAAGAGKRTAILLEDPVEPELMYRMIDHLAPTLLDLLGWLGVEDWLEETDGPLIPASLTEASPLVRVESSAPAFTSLVLAQAMLEWSDELRTYLKDWWPGDCPTPGAVRRGEAVWTSEQLTAIEQLCDLGDAPFWQPADTVGRTR